MSIKVRQVSCRYHWLLLSYRENPGGVLFTPPPRAARAKNKNWRRDHGVTLRDYWSQVSSLGFCFINIFGRADQVILLPPASVPDVLNPQPTPTSIFLHFEISSHMHLSQRIPFRGWCVGKSSCPACPPPWRHHCWVCPLYWHGKIFLEHFFMFEKSRSSPK